VSTDEEMGSLVADAKRRGRASTLGSCIAVQRDFKKPEG